MDPRLYECALVGDNLRLRQLISRDEHILERSAETANSNGNNILHIAAIYGHVDFASEVLSLKPELSSELNEAGLSPLHLAAAKGHLGIVKLLLAEDPDLSSLKDKHGRLPAHTAAMKGRLDVLKEIRSVNPWCLKEKTDRGETVLHLSVKENRVGVVKFLMSLEEVKTMVNEGDRCGNTALHLAAARNRREVTRFLINNIPAVDVNALNKYNVPPRELLNRRLTGSIRNENDEMVKLLSPSKAPASTEPAVAPSHNPASTEPAAAPSDNPAPTVPAVAPSDNPASTEPAVAPSDNPAPTEPAATDHSTEAESERISKARAKLADNTIIVAALIVTVTFQAALTPPGGFWQGDSADFSMKVAVAAISPSPLSPALSATPEFPISKVTAGTSVLSAKAYDLFMIADATAFLASLFVIVFLILSKSAVFPKPFVLFGLVLNILSAIVFLCLAFYFAIKATKPIGSDASEIFLKQIMNFLIGYFGGVLLVPPCIIAVTYFIRKLWPRRA